MSTFESCFKIFNKICSELFLWMKANAQEKYVAVDFLEPKNLQKSKLPLNLAKRPNPVIS